MKRKTYSVYCCVEIEKKGFRRSIEVDKFLVAMASFKIPPEDYLARQLFYAYEEIERIISPGKSFKKERKEVWQKGLEFYRERGYAVSPVKLKKKSVRTDNSNAS